MTYVLVLVACLSSTPGTPSEKCRVERIELPGITNATACHLAARLRLVEWLAQGHSIKQLADAKCEPLDARSASLP